MAKPKKKKPKKSTKSRARKAPRKRRAAKKAPRKSKAGTCKTLTICGRRRRICFGLKKIGGKTRFAIVKNTAA